jgi:hypothetical protein
MDPYQTLGVTRGCTREEVKNAFRARVWSAHPDLGGQESTFIEICIAYQKILAELDRRPGAVAVMPAQGPRKRPSSRPADPDWEPDLIVLAKPPDPRWEPDLVLLDEPPGFAPRPGDPRRTRNTYIAWLRWISTRCLHSDSASRSPGAFGAIVLLSVIIVLLSVCWIIWSHGAPVRARPQMTSYAAPL